MAATLGVGPLDDGGQSSHHEDEGEQEEGRRPGAVGERVERQRVGEVVAVVCQEVVIGA